MTKDLLVMCDWLHEHGCAIVALESTAVYWKPIFNLLEGDFQVLLVNPNRLRHVPGRKTDVKDCEWIAELLEHGLLQGSFIPPQEIRDLRDLTRYRRRLIEARSAEVNRLRKILEQANIKLASVTSQVMGVSGRAMLQALLEGRQTPEQMAELAKGRLRSKKKDLVTALEGRFRSHHAQLLSHILAHIDYLEERIAELERQIEERCRPFADELERLDSVPGINQRAAQDILAELGAEMSVFPSQKHLCGWAQLCPGNNESGGKRLSGRIGKGNKGLRAILVECAHAAGRSKQTYLGALYRRFISRKGRKRAAVVVAHSMSEAIYFILRDKVPYRDLGPSHFDRLNKEHVIRSHVRRLEALGFRVELQEFVPAA